MVNKSPLIIALDFADPNAALALADRLGTGQRVKVGKELFVRGGPQLVEQLVKRDYAVFLDLKFHDIPQTVANACRAAADLGVWMLNVHALGGQAMLQAAKEAVGHNRDRPLLIAVSILTSLEANDLSAVGLSGTITDNVLRLARLAQENGCDGLVCSPHEVPAIRTELGADFQLVTPGIRPQQVGHDDQKRVMTPQAALANGATYLVIGRAITQAAEPLQALKNIEKEIGLCK